MNYSVGKYKVGDRVVSVPGGWQGTVIRVLRQTKTQYRVLWDKTGASSVISALSLRSAGPSLRQ